MSVDQSAGSFQLDKKEYPVVSENDLGAPCCVVSPCFFLSDGVFLPSDHGLDFLNQFITTDQAN